MTDTVTINGVDYAPVSPCPTGTRAVVVVDLKAKFEGPKPKGDKK